MQIKVVFHDLRESFQIWYSAPCCDQNKSLNVETMQIKVTFHHFLYEWWLALTCIRSWEWVTGVTTKFTQLVLIIIKCAHQNAWVGTWMWRSPCSKLLHHLWNEPSTATHCSVCFWYSYAGGVMKPPWLPFSLRSVSKGLSDLRRTHLLRLIHGLTPNVQQEHGTSTKQPEFKDSSPAY